MFQVQTLLQSCGVGDVVASAFGGRNYLCSAEFTKRRALGGPQAADWRSIEEECLKGQKLQGLSTCEEVHACLSAQLTEQQRVANFPLLSRIHAIAFEDAAPMSLFDW